MAAGHCVKAATELLVRFFFWADFVAQGGSGEQKAGHFAGTFGIGQSRLYGSHGTRQTHFAGTDAYDEARH